MRALLASALLVSVLSSCAKAELAAPCEGDDECARSLECLPANGPQTAEGDVCSQLCGEGEAECEDGAVCWGFAEPKCIRSCDVTASECPDGTICATLVNPAQSEAYCVLPCSTAADCKDESFPFCPVPGGPCSPEENEAPPWAP